MKAAFYEKEITPPLGASIPGYFNLRQGSDVLDRLYARAMVLQKGDTTTAIVGVDGCTIPTEIHDCVAARVERYTGIKKENLVMAYVHTHTGIPYLTGEGKDDPAPRADVTAEARADVYDAQKGYFDVVCRLIADCVTLAYYRLEESKLRYGSGEVYGISFCRDYLMKNGTPRTNPPRCDPNIDRQAADIDPQLPVLFVEDAYGNPKGALISFGCHLDCVDGTKYSGDYASILAKELKKHYGPDFVTVFLMGTSGNVNHFDVTRKKDAPDHYVMMGKVLAGETLKAIAQSTPITDDTLSVSAKWLSIPRREIPAKKIKEAEHLVATVKMDPNVKLAADGTAPEQYERGMAKSLLEVAHGPESFNVLIQAIRIGSFTLFTMPGEPYNQFGTMVKEKAPTDQYMVAAMCNRSYGYLPVKEMYYDGIYPARIGSSRLSEDAGYIIVDNLIAMGKANF